MQYKIKPFFVGLILIITGVGLLKPNISTLVGQLYKENDERRDQGFTIFYIGINFGAFFSSLIVGYVESLWMALWIFSCRVWNDDRSIFFFNGKKRLI